MTAHIRKARGTSATLTAGAASLRWPLDIGFDITITANSWRARLRKEDWHEHAQQRGWNAHLDGNGWTAETQPGGFAAAGKRDET